MKKQFFPAPEVAATGTWLIQQHHPHLMSKQVRVEFVFCSDTPVKSGKEIWGQARKISSLTSYLRHEKEVDWTPDLTDEEIAAIQDEDAREVAQVETNFARDQARDMGNAAFFVITISQPIWEKLSHEHRLALVDHELMHCGACYDSEGKTKLTLIPHDFEGFNEEIQRHGLWRDDAVRLAETMKGVQLSLALVGEVAGE